MRKTIKTTTASLLFIAVIAAFFYLLIVGIKSDMMPKMSKEEIARTDLSENLVPLTTSISEWYPEQLYTPADFAAGSPAPGEGQAMYGTYRITLNIPKGRTYGIMGLTCSYAQRVYINGVLVSEVGNVADNAGDFVPRTDSFAVYFTPATDETEIITQLAHWNNKNGYYNGAYLGEQKLVVAAGRANFLASGLIVGTLFAFAVFFVGMFMFYPDKRHLLWFALMCFCSGLYFFIFQNKDIMALLPNLPWAVSHKAEYLSQLASYVLLLMHTVSVSKLKIAKWQKALFFTPVGGVMLYYIIAPSTFYSYHTILPMYTYACTVAGATAYVLYRAIREKLFQSKEMHIVMLCLLVGTGSYAFDLITNRNYNVLPFGTMLVVFFNAIAITMQFSRTERELSLAQLREKEIAETNAMMTRMSRLKSEFLHMVAHEMKTPLTIMSGFAQVADWQVQDGTVDENTSGRLKSIYAEADRLSAMVERLSELVFDNELTPPKGKVAASELMCYCADLCEPVARKNDNTLKTDCEGELYLYANRDSVLQVLLNLIVNANRHTDHGTIRISAKETDGYASFTVEDNGDGIAPEQLPDIFKKGVSGDNSGGLGLSISREIIEDGGGVIEVAHTGKSGTCFRFTLPLWREGEK